jgi:hypothetical protein
VVVQLVPTVQRLPMPHAPQAVLPQSTSVSVPFRTASVQLVAEQVRPVHTPLAQSLATTQAAVSLHGSGQPPPQSTSVSLPFVTRSEQVASWQAPPAHTLARQSCPLTQPSPVAHALHPEAPPQSMSVSSPFFVASKQLGARHRRSVPQTALAQSEATAHPSAVAHGEQIPPPQSTPVSGVVRRPSVHEEATQRPAWHPPPTQPPRSRRPSLARSP